ncbi:MAG: nickel pincer cofactor biosynthesis protein LarB [Verrucomicrobiota bacterium]|nr:nickel pincer cofactor biosynthesis protein LarB [Verrucomicrobiota bacterium]MEC7236069.1 nickel pincer cofactor biosynthesis protein LarB [Verrucomicrobiota bacterium]
MNTRKILEALQSGEIKLSDAEAQLKGFEDLGHSRVDLEREERNGIPEVIYGGGKTPEQIIDIMVSMEARGQNILATRIVPEVAVEIIQTYPAAVYHELARLVELRTFEPARTTEKIAIVCAGTSDLSVAEEARLTAEFYGNATARVYDAGVAGLHRLLASLETIRSCRVVVVVAGMEGALPSVVGGLVKAPIIAVPTSIGYGANFDGLSALLTMLNSCASGVSVVNIDNGFGAGFLASRINQL